MSPKQAAEWMGGAQLAQFFNVSAMTIWRWERDNQLEFPKPTIINSRKYWSRDDIDQWMKARAGYRDSRPTQPTNARFRKTADAS
jgi:predicted DNA-binding transcriptional regulator AlpA